jgi:PKD repeat protein
MARPTREAQLERNPWVRLAAICALIVASIAFGIGHAAASGDPEAAFSIDPALPPLTVKFVAKSAGFAVPVSSYQWSFGDGQSTTTTTNTVTHTYPAASTFMPSVMETAPDGESATATDTLKLSECSVGTTQCTKSLRNVGTVQLLQISGPTNTATLAEVNLLVGTFSFPHCDSVIQPAVAGTDTGFTGTLTATLQYTTSDPAEVATTCFSSTVSFVDATGATVKSGPLPRCATSAPSPPCVQSISTSGQQVTKLILIPPGDPKVGVP